MVMVMARRKLEQAIVGSDVRIRVTDVDVGVPNVRGLHRKADDGSYSWCYAALQHAAGCGIKLFVAHHPLVAQELAVHNQIR